MKNGLLLLNGAIGQRELALMKTSSFDLIVAADGGANFAFENQIHPQVIIGDFDSVGDSARSAFKKVQWVHKPSQEKCDLEKGLDYCLEVGIQNLTIVGFSGKRLDHTLGNLSVLLRYDQQLKLNLPSEDADWFFVRKRLELSSEPGQLVSLIPFGQAHGVCTRGLKYPLKGESLALGQREGTSNLVLGRSFRVELEEGVILLCKMVTKSDHENS